MGKILHRYIPYENGEKPWAELTQLCNGDGSHFHCGKEAKLVIKRSFPSMLILKEGSKENINTVFKQVFKMIKEARKSSVNNPPAGN